MPGPPANYHPLVRSVARALRQRCHVTPGSSIVVACSGGADSVALLRALAMLATRRKWRLNLIVGHVQHHLREEAEDDAHFVETLARELGLPYARRDIRPAELPGNLEANARRLRYAALAEIAHEHNATTIATAHHAGDQLETMLMWMLRGSSVAGLRGIAWRKTVDTPGPATPLQIIRPMLGVGRDSNLALLDQLGQPYRHDSTNDDTTRTRANLRHDVLPLLKSLQPDAANKANQLADHFRDLYDLVQSSAEEAIDELPVNDGSGFVLSRQQARKMNRIVLIEVLRRALRSAGTDAGQLSRHTLLRAVDAAQDQVGGARLFGFGKSIQLEITRDHIALKH